MTQEETGHVIRQFKAGRPNALGTDQLRNVGQGSVSDVEPSPFLLGELLRLRHGLPDRARSTHVIHGRTNPEGLPQELFQDDPFAAQGDAAVNLLPHPRTLLQPRNGLVQGDQNALAFVVRGVLEEVRDGAAIAVGQLRQLQRGDGAAARFDVGDCRARNAKRVGHRPLAQPPHFPRGP